MKYSFAFVAAAFGFVNATPSTLDTRTNPQGFDVSAWQGNVDWAKAKADGASFAIVKVRVCIFIPVRSVANRKYRQQKAQTTKAHTLPSNMTGPTTKDSSEAPTTSPTLVRAPEQPKLSTSLLTVADGPRTARLFPA